MTANACRCGRPAPNASLCDRCKKTLDMAIVNIAAYHADLDTLRSRQVRYGNRGPARKGGETPAGMDLRFAKAGAASEIDHDTRNMITSWARHVMDAHPEIPGPTCHLACLHVSCSRIRRSRHPDDTVSSCCAYLLRWSDWLRVDEAGPEILDELLDLESRLRRLVDRPPERVYLGTCKAIVRGEECGGSVYAIGGERSGRCDRPDCRAEYDADMRRTGMEEELDSRLCTAAAVASLSAYLGLKASRDRVRKRVNHWHRRGRITPDAHSPAGEPMFRYGAVRGLLYVEFGEQEHAS